MKKVKIIAGVAWAVAGLIAIIVLFPGLNSFSTSASRLPFMKINPNYSGGEVAGQVITACCTIDIRRPVFDGLFGERKIGFVQVDWRGNLPDLINDTIDYDFDTIPDFTITIERADQKTTLKTMDIKVIDVGISTATSYGWAARVNIKK